LSTDIFFLTGDTYKTVARLKVETFIITEQLKSK